MISKIFPKSKDKLFDGLVQKHYDNIHKFCYYRLQQDKYLAEDCAQEVFIILYNSMDKLYDLEKIDGWLYKTTDHLVKRAKVNAAKEKKKIEYGS